MMNLRPQQIAAALDCLRADRIVAEHPLTASDELVWRELFFRWRNRKTGSCWPALSTIAKAAGLSRRTVCTSIKRLRAAGWLKWARRRIRLKGGRWTQGSNDYELKIPRRWMRVVSECKRSAGTTSIFIKIAGGHLMRPPRAPAVQPVAPTVVPPGYGANSLAAIEDEGLRAALARLGAAIDAKEARRRGG